MRFALVMLVALLPLRANSALIKATSVSLDDVQTAVNAASSGDTIHIPPGSATWTNGITTTKRVEFVGSNSGELTNYTERTFITWNGGTVNAVFNFTGTATNSAQPFGVSYLSINGNSVNVTFGHIRVGLGLTSTVRFFRVHHNKLTNISGRGIAMLGVTEGLVDNNAIDMPFNLNGQAIMVRGFNRVGANYEVAYPGGGPGFGVTNFFTYVEHNVITSAFEQDASIELYDDARAVTRYNTIVGTTTGAHESSTNRSATIYEHYGNQFFYTNGGACSKWLELRSGIGTIWSNTVTFTGAQLTITNIIHRYYRASGTNVFPPPTYVCNLGVTGTNRYDFNGNNPPNGLNIVGYPCGDQIGWGDNSSGLSTFSGTNLTQTFYGSYYWENRVNGGLTTAYTQPFCAGGNCNAGLVCAAGLPLPEDTDLIVDGRDFFNETQRPGYTPLGAHPLSATVSISPTSASVAQLGAVDFSDSGGLGSGRYYIILVNSSGGSVNESTGLYTAGTTDGVDMVRVLDPWGNISDSSVTVSGASSGVGSPIRLRRKSI